MERGTARVTHLFVSGPEDYIQCSGPLHQREKGMKKRDGKRKAEIESKREH